MTGVGGESTAVQTTDQLNVVDGRRAEKVPLIAGCVI